MNESPREPIDVLFVDDETNILDAIRRMMHPLRDAYRLRFCCSGQDAIRLMAERPASIIVTDMRMPHMSGAQLLNIIARKYPATLRIILTGEADKVSLMQAAGVVHRWLSKPCEPEKLFETLNSLRGLEGILRRPELHRLLGGVTAIPTLPRWYNNLIAELDKPGSNLDAISAAVEQDAGMTAKLLHLSNSAFASQRRVVVRVRDAVALFGLEMLRAMATTYTVFCQLTTQPLPRQLQDDLLYHGERSATLAGRIAQRAGMSDQDHGLVILAGMLHDVGKLLLLQLRPREWDSARQTARQDHIPLWRAEAAALGADHGEVGGFLLGLWGFDPAVVQAVAFHHQPAKSGLTGLTPLVCVHVADALCHQAEAGDDNHLPSPELDMDYLTACGLTPLLDDWRTLLAA